MEMKRRCLSYWMMIVLMAVLVMAGSVVASAGDRDPRYRECLSKCVVRKCEMENRQISEGFVYSYRESFEMLPNSDDALYLPGLGEWIFGWPCDENCRYECTHKNTIMRQKNGESVVQYHGKWPFVRVFGIQELFSSLFSFFNAIPHILFLSAMLSCAPFSSDNRRFPADHSIQTAFSRLHWMSWAIVGVNTWFWS